MSRSSESMPRRAAATALALLLVAGCTSGRQQTAGTTTSGPTAGPTTAPDAPTGGSTRVTTGAAGRLSLLLSKGTVKAAASPVAVVAGTPLGADGIAAIAARLSPWVDDGSTAAAFAWPTASLPTPRAGVTTNVPFPAPSATPPATTTGGPLHVTRVQPDGQVPIAPFVTIGFDQPMVPVATVAQLAAAAVPATLTPAIAGHWRWVGTQTLRFDADDATADRLPMATEFTVTVPAGTASATGGTLAAAWSSTFRTPPPTVQAVQPTDGQTVALRPVLVLSFDQRVDPAAVVGHLALRADGKARAVRLATDAEIAADRSIATDTLVPGRWLAVRPAEPLPTDASITLAVAAGAPSAEGPLTTSDVQQHGWRTYAPLRIERTSCGGPGECPPSSGLVIEFDNQLDAERFDPAAVTVSPPLSGLAVVVYGNVVQVQGETKARTTYEVTLPATLTDVYGQTLGAAKTVALTIGASTPMIEPFGAFLTTLDPLVGKPTLTIATVNHDAVRVRLFRVAPGDWDAFRRFSIEFGQPDAAAVPPWPVVLDRRVDTSGTKDERHETHLDLAGALGGDGLGHLVALVESTETYPQDDARYWQNRPALTWLQATHVGVDAFPDDDEVRVWATDLATGTPIAGVAIAALGSGGEATTGADGVARLRLGSTPVAALVATSGADTAVLPRDLYGPGWTATGVTDEPRWYVVDDRHTYRPGETVSVKGVLRRFATAGDARLHVVTGGTVRYTVNDAQGILLSEGRATLTPLGGFDLAFALPAGANQGPASISFSTDALGAAAQSPMVHQFAVQSFRRPDYEVTTHAAGAEPFVSSRPATVAVDATYYSGGPLGAAPVTWTVTTGAASYAPPGWAEWSFGTWSPWWYADRLGAGRTGGFDAAIDGPTFGGPSSSVRTFTGTTDSGGTDALQIGFAGTDGVLPDLPTVVQAQATVTDLNRQALASTTDILVHPSDHYVGLRSAQTFVRRGDPLDVDAIVTSIDGKVAAGRPVRVTASRSTWTMKAGQWTEVPADVQTCDRTSGADPVRCTFTTSVGGTFTITAITTDDNGASSRSELTRWVTGGQGRPDRTVDQEQLTVVPAKAGYAPGDTAEVLVQAPFEQGHGIMTVTHVGIDATVPFEVSGGTGVVRLPLTEADVPSASLAFEVVGTTPRAGDDGRPLDGAPPRPAFATGSLTLKVSTASRALTVRATPRAAAVAPGSTTAVDVSVTGPDGHPVAGAELAVAVVDEAVLALGPYRWPDPLDVFYGPRQTYDQATYGRSSIALRSPQDLAYASGGGRASAGAATTAAAAAATVPRPVAAPADTASPSGAGAYKAEGGVEGAPAIDTRTNFDALAVFEPAVLTAADGRATVDVTLPDNLTRYRVMVVAVSGDDRFGSTDAAITARKPLMVRPSAPRFLNFGDVFELPVVVQNQTDQALTADVVLQTSNLTTTAPGRRVDVPANGRVEVRFPVSAVAAGTARLRVAAAAVAAAGPVSDAATVELAVYTPVTTEAFATYGVVDGGATAQPLRAPTGVIPQYGGLDVTTSSTALAGLSDAVLSVVEQPYDSTDARATRILAVTSLRDVLGQFHAAGLPTAAVLDASVADDVAAILARQNDDGGFGFWGRDRPSDPWVTIEAAHALVAARTAGATVRPDQLDRALQYLRTIESTRAADYGERVRNTVSAYALYVRNLAGDRDRAKAAALWTTGSDAMGVDAMAWLWPVVDDPAIGAEIARRIGNGAVETAGAVTFTSGYVDDAYVILQSDHRTDAVVLDALIARAPKDPLIPKVVAGLLAGRNGDAWASTQESSFVLMALKRYFDTYERQTPDFVARVWLGDRYAGDQRFTGRSADRLDVHVPTADLTAAGDTSVVVAKEGTGRLYYRIGLTSAPADLHSAALDRGFVVQRTYEAVDDPADVSLDAAGVWHVKAGATVRVRVTMVAESQRTHVALVDPLPAGLEIVNPALATTPDVPSTGAVPAPGSAPRWWYPTWFEHQNLTDDRAEAFATVLPGGAYDYAYVTRATTPGTFVVPPVRAQEVYEPETFGRGASTTMVIAP